MSLSLSLLCIHKLLNLNIDIACLLLSREFLNKRKASRPVVFVSFYSVYIWSWMKRNDDGDEDDDDEVEEKEDDDDDDDDEKTKSKLKWMIISQNSTRSRIDHVRRWFQMLLLLLLMVVMMMMMWMLLIGRMLCGLREAVRKVDRVMFVIVINIRR